MGCAASFDERNQKVARSTISLLKEAGLDVGILGMQEGCSGDPARRAGNEYLFQMLAETNLMTFQELGVKRIIASCRIASIHLEKSTGTMAEKNWRYSTIRRF